MEKKSIVCLILILILILNSLIVYGATGSLEILFPHPFGQQILIDGKLAKNLPVTITNLRTEDQLKQTTNEEGWYLDDLANLPRGYIVGDIISVTICRTDNDCKTFQVEVKKEPEVFAIDIDWKTKQEDILPTDKLLSGKQFNQFVYDYKDKLTEGFNNQTEILMKESKKQFNEGIIITFIVTIIFSLLPNYFITHHFANKYKCKYEPPKK